MNRKWIIRQLLFFIVIWFNSCDHGLAPAEVEVPVSRSGITGQITYTNWPDSVINLKIIVFKEFPPENILVEIQSGNAIVYPPELEISLPKYVDSTAYSLLLEPGEYGYVVIAEQFGGLFDWRAVGQHDTTALDSLPTSVTVLPDSFLNGINIDVDFNNLPIQPF